MDRWAHRGREAGSWREVWWELECKDEFWMCLQAGKEMDFICTAEWFCICPTMGRFRPMCWKSDDKLKRLKLN